MSRRTRSRREPEPETQITHASLLRRLVAHVIDLLFLLSYLGVFVLLLVDPDGWFFPSWVSAPVVGAAILVTAALYYVSESVMGGSPGKYYMNIELCRMDGKHLGIPQALLRSLLKLLSHCMPLVFLTCIFDKKKRAPYDFIGSQVINRREDEEPSATKGAPLWKRFVAHILDLLLLVPYLFLLICVTVIGLMIAQTEQRYFGAIGIAVLIVAIPYYFVWAESSPHMATPGKRFFGLTVCNKIQGTISVKQSLGRVVLKLAMHLCPFLLLIPLFSSSRVLPQDIDEIYVMETDGSVFDRHPGLLSGSIILGLIACAIGAYAYFGEPLMQKQHSADKNSGQQVTSKATSPDQDPAIATPGTTGSAQPGKTAATAKPKKTAAQTKIAAKPKTAPKPKTPPKQMYCNS